MEIPAIQGEKQSQLNRQIQIQVKIQVTMVDKTLQTLVYNSIFRHNQSGPRRRHQQHQQYQPRRHHHHRQCHHTPTHWQ
jgi:hypothetical protein